MEDKKVLKYIEELVKNVPSDWLNLTTHRLDIYNEDLAKKEFLEHFEELFSANKVGSEVLEKLPTAYDYIRLGHPLSTVLEWAGDLSGCRCTASSKAEAPTRWRGAMCACGSYRPHADPLSRHAMFGFG